MGTFDALSEGDKATVNRRVAEHISVGDLKDTAQAQANKREDIAANGNIEEIRKQHEYHDSLGGKAPTKTTLGDSRGRYTK